MNTKVSSARNRDDFGPFVTAVFTVSNGDVSTSVNYGNDVTNNNTITTVNENGLDKTKPQKSSIKKPTIVYKGHVSEDANGRKTVSFTEDTLDNESASKVLRKESRRKQRIVHHDMAPPVRHNGPFEKEEIERSMRIDDFESPTSTEEPSRSVLPAQLSNGHVVSSVPPDGRNHVTNNTYKHNGHLLMANGNIHDAEAALEMKPLPPEMEQFVHFDQMLRIAVRKQRHSKSCCVAGVCLVLTVAAAVCLGIALYFLLPG